MSKLECKYKFQDAEKFEGKPYCTLFNELCKDLSFVCDKNCQVYDDYKQLEELKAENLGLLPFEDEYFKGLETKTIAELAKKSIRLTAENSKLEQILEDIKDIAEQILDDDDNHCPFELTKQILQEIKECKTILMKINPSNLKH